MFLQAHQWFHDYFVLFRILTLQANFNASIPQLFCSKLYSLGISTIIIKVSTIKPVAPLDLGQGGGIPMQ